MRRDDMLAHELTRREAAAEDRTARVHSRARGWRFWLSLLALGVLQLPHGLDVFGVALATPAIVTSIGDAATPTWLQSALLLAVVAFSPSIAHVADIFGRRAVVAAAVLLAVAGCILSALAHSLGLLLAGRVLQGFMMVLALPLCDIMVSDLVSLRLRGLFNGGIQFFRAVSALSAPPLGGVWSTGDEWRNLFWLMTAYLVVAGGVLVAIYNVKRPHDAARVQLRRVDWLGNVTYWATAFLVVFPLTNAGVLFRWRDAGTVVPLVLAPFALAAFVWTERRAAQPIMPAAIFTRTSTCAFVLVAIQTLCWCVKCIAKARTHSPEG